MRRFSGYFFGPALCAAAHMMGWLPSPPCFQPAVQATRSVPDPEHAAVLQARLDFNKFRNRIYEQFRDHEITLEQGVDRLLAYCLRRYPRYLVDLQNSENRAQDLRTLVALNLLLFPDCLANIWDSSEVLREVCERMDREFKEQFTADIDDPVVFHNRPSWADSYREGRVSGGVR